MSKIRYRKYNWFTIMEIIADCRKQGISKGYLKYKEDINLIELTEEDEGGVMSLCINEIQMGDFDDIEDVYAAIQKALL